MKQGPTYLGIFLVAMATLMLEILLTRIVSVQAWYHLAFFIISIGMLGMTAGALGVFLGHRLFPEHQVGQRLAQSSLAFALSVPVSLFFVLSARLLPVSDFSSFLSLLGTGAALAIPFVFSGSRPDPGVDPCGASSRVVLRSRSLRSCRRLRAGDSDPGPDRRTQRGRRQRHGCGSGRRCIRGGRQEARRW